MTCSSCVHRIETNVAERPGMISASVSLATSRGVFAFDPAVIGPRDVIKAVEVSEWAIVLVSYCIGCAIIGFRIWLLVGHGG